MNKQASDIPPNDPHIVAVRFQPLQLRRAREIAGLTKAELAERIGKTPSSLSQFESGSIKPDAQTLAGLSMSLGVPVSFFARERQREILDLNDCHFRTLRSASQQKRRQSVRIGEVLDDLLRVLEDFGVSLPSENVLLLKRQAHSPEEIEQLATEVRRTWGLGLGPITRPIQLLESKGIRVLPLSKSCEEVDAFSFWRGKVPVILLSLSKPPSRVHFDVAHELGHLVLHDDVVPGSTESESEADLFASAFLMPQETFSQEIPSRWNFSVFLALKRRWHVSIQAAVYRSYRLGKISLSSYRRAFMYLNHFQFRRAEPDEWLLDRPHVLRKALSLVEQELPMSEIATALGLHSRFLSELVEPLLGGPGC
jgi:Zn-dependent peptidase ImmA (M78 family)/DNA-binding XRE family transcriptional regulator